MLCCAEKNVFLHRGERGGEGRGGGVSVHLSLRCREEMSDVVEG